MTSPDPKEEFRRGVRAMFDYLLYRAANNYHANHEIQKQCDYDNALIKSWVEDALLEIYPEDYSEWRSIIDAYHMGVEVGKRMP